MGEGEKSLEVLIDTETEAELQRSLYPSVSYIFYSHKGPRSQQCSFDD